MRGGDRDPLGETPGPGRGGVSRLFPWSPPRRARLRCDHTGKEAWARPRPAAPSRVRKWCLSVMLQARFTEGADVRRQSRGMARRSGPGCRRLRGRGTAPPRPRPGSALRFRPSEAPDPVRVFRPRLGRARRAAGSGPRRRKARGSRRGPHPPAARPQASPPLCAVGAVARATPPPRPAPPSAARAWVSARPPAPPQSAGAAAAAAGRGPRFPGPSQEQSSALRACAVVRPGLLLPASVRWPGPADQLALRLRTEARRPPQGPARQSLPGAARLPAGALPLMTPGGRLPWRGTAQTRWWVGARAAASAPRAARRGPARSVPAALSRERASLPEERGRACGGPASSSPSAPRAGSATPGAPCLPLGGEGRIRGHPGPEGGAPRARRWPT